MAGAITPNSVGLCASSAELIAGTRAFIEFSLGPE
jgi:hypothetical protein